MTEPTTNLMPVLDREGCLCRRVTIWTDDRPAGESFYEIRSDCPIHHPKAAKKATPKAAKN